MAFSPTITIIRLAEASSPRSRRAERLSITC